VTPKRGSLFGALVAVAIVFGVALLLVPSFAAGVGRLVASLWVTVMGAVVGILGAFMGR